MPLNIELYGVVPQVLLHNGPEQPFQYPDHFEKPEKLSLMPFQTKTYETKLTLINNETSFDYSGTLYSHDIVVEPGENRINSLFIVFDGDGTIINVDSGNFDQKIITCENFIDEKRRQTCQKKIGTEQYVNEYFNYSFNYPKNLKIFQEASSDNQEETLLGSKDSPNFLILINAYKNTEKLTTKEWTKRVYGDNQKNLLISDYPVDKIANESVVTYSLAENQGRDFGYSLSFTKTDHPYIFEIKFFYDKNDEKLLSDFNKIVETFNF